MAMKNNEKFKIIENNIQKEALTNEVKGNLFEYLVAQGVARSLGVESAFVKNADRGLHETLRYYQDWLRKNQPELLKKLPALATPLVDRIISYAHQYISSKVINVLVLGKIAAGHHQDQFAEADIIIVCENENIPFSIKLSKSHAFLNTKSAGVKSFFSRYFELFGDSSFKQDILNDVIDKSFQNFGNNLYHRRGLDFQGRFDHMWKWSELPSSLKDDDRVSFDEFLQEVLLNLHKNVTELLKADQSLFLKCLMPLMGFSNLDVIQAGVFHRSKKNEGYIFEKAFVKDSSQYKSVKIEELDGKKSSFNIYLDNDILQIRLKPMNKFTTASYKVNCAVKYQEDSEK